MPEPQKRVIQDLLNLSLRPIDYPKNQEGSLHENDINTTPAGQSSSPSPIGMSKPADPNFQLHFVNPSIHGLFPHPQYVTISVNDIKRIEDTLYSLRWNFKHD